MLSKPFACVILAACFVSPPGSQFLFAQNSAAKKEAALAKFTPPKINETLSAEESQIETEIEKQLDTYSESLDAIYPLLTHANPKVRAEAINRLGFMQDEVELQVQPIADRLSDPNVDVAGLAAYLLQPMGAKAVAALPALMWAIEQEDGRFEAAFSTIGALGAAGAPAVPRLIQFASAKTENAPEIVREKQYCAIEALGEIGPAAASAKSILKTELQDWGHSETAGIALGKIGAEDLLLAEFNQAEEPKRGAVVGLGYLAKPSPAVLQNLAKYIAANSKDEYDRAEAYKTAGRLRPTTLEILTLLGQGTKDSNEVVRQSALRAIGDIEPALPEAMPYLLAALADEQETVRQYATSALGRLKIAPEVRLDALLKAGSEGDHGMRSSVEHTFFNSTEVFWPLIWDRAKDPSPPAPLRAYTILSLRLFYEHTKEYDPFVTAVLEDQKEPEIVRIAAACIAWYGHQNDKEIVALLKRGLMQDESESVLEVSLSHLADNRNPENVPLFVELLQKRSKAKARTNEIYDALKEMGPKAVAAVPELIVQLKVQNSVVQYQIVNTLGSIGPGAIDAFDPLLELMRNSKDYDSSLRKNAREALETIAPNDPRLAEVILAELRDEDSMRRYIREHEAEAGPMLLNMMKSDRAEDRRLGIEFLMEVFPKGTRAVVEKALDDPDPQVQQGAAVAWSYFEKSKEKQIDLLMSGFLASQDELDWKLNKALQNEVYAISPRMLDVAIDPQVPMKKRRWAFNFLCGNLFAVESMQSKLEPLLKGPTADSQQPAAVLLGLIGVANRQSALVLLAALDADLSASCLAREQAYRALSNVTERAKLVLSTKIVDKLLDEVCSGDMETANSCYSCLGRAILSEQQADRLLRLLDDDERRALAYGALTCANYVAPEKVFATLVGRLSVVDEDHYFLLEALKQHIALARPALLALAVDDKQPIASRELALRVLTVKPVAEEQQLSIDDARKLLPNLKDENVRVRQWTAIVLARVANKAGPLLPHLTEALTEEDSSTRGSASYIGFAALKEKAAPAVPEIIELLGNEKKEIRSTAIETLGYIGTGAEAAVPMLIAILERNEDARAHNIIAWTLTQIGKPAQEQLIAALQQATGNDRLVVLQALVKFHSVTIVPELQRSLASNNPLERRVAAVALASYPQAGDACVVVLTEMTQDEDNEQVRMGIEGLGRMGVRAKAAVPVLLEKLANRNLRYVTLKSLSEMKTAAEPALPALVDLLEHPKLCSIAAEILGEIGSPSANEALIAELEYPAHVLAAAQALAKIKPTPVEQVLPKLYELLKDPAQQVTTIQAIQCFGVDAKSAIPVLKRYLDSDNDQVRQRATYALGQVGVGSQEVSDILLGLFDDKSPEVQELALLSVGHVAAQPEKCVPALLDKLARSEESQRIYILAGLQGFEKSAAPAVPVLLKEHLQDPELQPYVIETLGVIGDDAAFASVPLLIEVLKQKDAPGRKQAIDCLGNFGALASETLPLLESLTKDSNPEIQNAALRAFWQIDPFRADELELPQPREDEEYNDEYEDY